MRILLAMFFGIAVLAIPTQALAADELPANEVSFCQAAAKAVADKAGKTDTAPYFEACKRVRFFLKELRAGVKKTNLPKGAKWAYCMPGTDDKKLMAAVIADRIKK